MKKKIKDLTGKEVTKICRKNKHCVNSCPLYDRGACLNKRYRINIEKEVEIDE